MVPWRLLVFIILILQAISEQAVLGPQLLSTIKVLTQNMDRGSDLTFLTGPNTPFTFEPNVQKTVEEIILSEPNVRAKSIVLEIGRFVPDLVFLSELAYVKNDTHSPPTTVTVDALSEVLKELETMGLNYGIGVLLEGEDWITKTSLPGTGYVLFREREIILYNKDNTDLKILNSKNQKYTAHTKLTDYCPEIYSRYGSIDIVIKNQITIRFIGTHLSENSEVQIAQGNELIEILQKTEIPFLLVGDFSSDANQGKDPKHPPGGSHLTPTYSNLITHFTDVWPYLHSHPGLTWPLYLRDPFINERLEPYERLDLIFIKKNDNNILPKKMDLYGGRKCKAFEPIHRVLISDHMFQISEFEIYA
jgi:endonuclease/exonuclease/phosphatase family metal-dependent hydrolase